MTSSSAAFTPDQLAVQQLRYQLMALSRDASVSSSSCKQQTELLARALALVSQRHAISSPTRARDTVLAALDELKAALQQHQQQQQQLTVEHQESEYDSSHQELLQTALLTLWANVATYELLVALADVLTAVEFVPHALRFWKKRCEDPLLAAIENAPFEWMLSDDQRVTIEERVYSLAYTRDAVLETLGNLKELATRIWATAPDDNHELRGLVAEASKMLEHAYDSSGIVPPRRGKGAFKTLAPLDFTRIRFESCVTSETGTAKVTGASVLLSLDKLHTNLVRFEASRSQYASCFKTAMAPCVVPSKLRQRWLHLTVTAACVVTGGVWVLRNPAKAQETVRSSKSWVQQLLTDVFVEPLVGVVNEISANQTTREVPSIVQSTSRSLLATVTNSVVDKEWMAEWRRAYQEEIDTHKELLLYYRIIVAFPAAVLLQNAFSVGMSLIAIVRAWVRDQLKTPRAVSQELQDAVRRLERHINKQLSTTGTPPTARDVGKLLLLIHQLRVVFDSNRRHFERGFLKRLHQDINDLAADGLEPTQRLWIIQRMHHAHSFCV